MHFILIFCLVLFVGADRPLFGASAYRRRLQQRLAALRTELEL